jgi:dolichol kinase
MNDGMTAKRSINIYRILWHCLTGFVIVVILWITYPSTRLVSFILLAAFLLFLVVDILRFTTHRGRELFWNHMSFLAGEKEKKGLNTSVYYAFSLLICVNIYEPKIAMGAIICLAVGDVTANIVGKRFGRYRLKGKSVEGMLGNAIVCFAICYFIVPSPFVAAAGAITGALVEFLPVPLLNDNILIPLCSGLAMTLVA